MVNGRCIDNAEGARFILIKFVSHVMKVMIIANSGDGNAMIIPTMIRPSVSQSNGRKW